MAEFAVKDTIKTVFNTRDINNAQPEMYTVRTARSLIFNRVQ